MDPLAEKYYDVSPYVYCLGNPINLFDPDGRKIRVFNDCRELILDYINNIAQGRFDIDKNGYLYLKEATNELFHSSTYMSSLVNAINNDKNTINIYMSDYFYDKDGVKRNISEKGQGVTTKYNDGDLAVVISGQSYNKLTDYNDAFVPDPPELVLAHELTGHAEPTLNYQQWQP